MTEEGEVIIRRRRWPRVLAVVALLIGVLMLSLWLARKPIARGEVDSYLKAANVPARYTLTDLGLGRQRLTNVVIGDPASPDLVADWLETHTRWGLRGPTLAGVRGGHVRVSARWANGKLSLGTIDRLLPKGDTGKPFSLPALALDVEDLRARIETPWGLLGAKLVGSGRLDGGFDGRLAVTSARLGGVCDATRPEGLWRVRTLGAGLTSPARVRLEGSTQVAALACADATTGFANANGTATLALGDRLRWAIVQDVAATTLRHRLAAARTLTGRVRLAGDETIRGQVALQAGDLRTTAVRAARATLDGAVYQDTAHQRAFAYDGWVGWAGGRWSLPVAIPPAPGTPVAPLLQRLGQALATAAIDTRGDIRLTAIAAPAGAIVHVATAAVSSASGASLRYDGGPAPIWTARDGARFGGIARLAGGGLPTATIRFDDRPGVLGGTATIDPYAAADARLALTQVAFSNANGWRVTTRATLSGPLAGGRVDGLTLPIDATWRNGALALGPGCTPIGWQRIAISGLTLDPGGLTLCPEGPALVRAGNGGVDGGARIAAARLTGRLGSTPLTLATTGARVRLATRAFALTGVEALIGAPTRMTRLTAGTLDGRFGSTLAGQFTDAGGLIANVPLAMSGAAGTWRFADGTLTVDGALTVADTEPTARFQPLAARGVTLSLAGNRIVANGVLLEPTTGTKVADVAIRHDLSAGRGTADLTVPALSFVKGFQPELLTRLTFGVIADVRGTVTGEGHLAWTPEGVSSTGVFRTAGTDLAAAFGPVTGIAGTIRFTDLLQLQSAPDQQVTVKSINPGVPVTDGVITFQTLPGTRVRVAGGRWPFAGGALTLDPTLLDFSAAAQRRMTFHVTGAAADKFLQSFDFKNLDATGTFDGVLPMVFDSSGGRIEDGRLAVRPGGGTIAYVGDISRKNLGFWGNYAFDTLKSLRYRSLGITLNGPLAGEMVTEVRFAGISQGKGAKSNFLIRRLQRLPVVFNIRIKAPFRGLLDSTASFYDPKRLIERNLPGLIERQKAIQPPASETVP